MNHPYPPPAGEWIPTLDRNGNNVPPCPRCQRKGPDFNSRYHPCKGIPCNPCADRTRKRDGSGGGLTAHDCRTGRGGTPHAQQKPHKVQKRKQIYVFRGVEYVLATKKEAAELSRQGKVADEREGMGYEREELADVCPGCRGWEWCWCGEKEEVCSGCGGVEWCWCGKGVGAEEGYDAARVRGGGRGESRRQSWTPGLSRGQSQSSGYGQVGSSRGPSWTPGQSQAGPSGSAYQYQKVEGKWTCPRRD